MARFTNYRRFILGLPLLFGATACPNPPTGDHSVQEAPIAVNGTLVLRNTATHQLDIVGVEAKLPKISHLAYADAPGVRQVTRDGKRALLLDVASRALSVTDGKAITRFTLPSEFAALQDSDDSLAAVLWHPAQAAELSTLVNTDEVALVDLAAKPSKDNPQTATLTGLGRAPIRARVSPPVQAADGVHRLVWVEAAGRLGLADFGPGGKKRSVIVPLAADSKSLITPLRTEARVGAGVVDLYLLAESLDDVVHIHVDLQGADLLATLDQVAAGAKPVDLHLFDTKEGLRVLSANWAAKSLSLLDPATGTGLEIPLEFAVTRFVPLLPPDGKPRLLAWTHSFAVARAYLIDLEDLLKKKGKAIRKVDFNYPITAVYPVGGQVVAQLSSASVSAAVLDAVNGKVTEFQGAGKLAGIHISTAPAGTAIWLLGGANGKTRLSRIDLGTLHGNTLEFAVDGALHLAPLGESGVAVLGSGLAGWWVVALPQGELVAAKTHWLEGFGLDGFLQGGAP